MRSDPLGNAAVGVKVTKGFFLEIAAVKLWEKVARYRPETHTKKGYNTYDHNTLIEIYERYKKAKFGEDVPYWEIKFPSHEDYLQRYNDREVTELPSDILEEEE